MVNTGVELENSRHEIATTVENMHVGGSHYSKLLKANKFLRGGKCESLPGRVTLSAY